MSKNKINHPVVLSETFFEQWPGFKGSRELGELKLLEWPVEHPDTHCRKGAYTPNDQGICSCGWIPGNKIHCEACGKTLRRLAEESLLKEMIRRSNYSPPEIACAIYLGYVAKFDDQLVSTPDLDAVADWYEAMEAQEQEALLEEHLTHRSIIITVGMPLDGDMEDILSMIGEEMFQTFNDEQLKDMLTVEDLPEDLAEVIHGILSDRHKKTDEGGAV